MRFEESNTQTFPKCEARCLIYFLLQGNEVVYVGQTITGMTRPYSHIDKEYDSIKVLPCEREHLDETEDFYMAKYKPKYNKMRNRKVVCSLTRVKSLLKEKMGNKVSVWVLPNMLEELKIVPFRDEFNGEECITVFEYNRIEKYIGRISK